MCHKTFQIIHAAFRFPKKLPAISFIFRRRMIYSSALPYALPRIGPARERLTWPKTDIVAPNLSSCATHFFICEEEYKKKYPDCVSALLTCLAGGPVRVTPSSGSLLFFWLSSRTSVTFFLSSGELAQSFLPLSLSLSPFPSACAGTRCDVTRGGVREPRVNACAVRARSWRRPTLSPDAYAP